MRVDADNWVSKVVERGSDDGAYDRDMAWLATADHRVMAESGLARYLEEIWRVPMLEPQDEFMLAKRWREHGDHEAAHKLVNSHLRLVAKIAMGYRGYGLPISELISEGNVGLMQAVKLIARRLGVTEQDLVDMNRRLGGDVSLDAPIREDGNPGEWQNWLVDEHADQETTLAASEEFDCRRKALASAVSALNDRERRIFEARRLAEEPITLKELADEFGITRERVRQIGVRAFEKVQKSVKKGVAVMETPALLPAQ